MTKTYGWGETANLTTHAVLRNGTKIQRAERASKWYAVRGTERHQFDTIAVEYPK